MATANPHLSIGQLARSAGVSVRALHHYDAIGLLAASLRTAGGARRYSPEDVVRLHQVQALRQMGYSLADIAQVLQGRASPLDVLERQIAVLDERAAQARRLSRGLRHLAGRLADGQPVGAGDWLGALELMTVYDQHLSEREVDLLRARDAGQGGRLEAAWARLVQEVSDALDQHLPPTEKRAHALAWSWTRLVIERTGNDASLAVKLRTLHGSQRRAQQICGISPAMFDWLGHALAHARGALFARHLSACETREVVQRQIDTMAHMQAWPQLVALLREQMEAGVPPGAGTVRALAQRWRALWRDSLSGGDERLERRLRAAFDAEPDLRLGVGVDDRLLAYARDALAVEAGCAG